MKFICDNCQAKYQIPDEKVGGRTLRMACRKCGKDILIRGAGASPSIPPPAASPRPAPTGVPKPAAPRTPAAVPAPAAATKSIAPPPPAVATGARASQLPDAPAAPAEEWHVAVNDVPVGPLQRDDIARKIGTGAVTGDSLAWREGFDDWRPLREIPQLASLLEQRRRPSVPLPRVTPAPPASVAPAPPASVAPVSAPSVAPVSVPSVVARPAAPRPRTGPVGVPTPERVSAPPAAVPMRVAASGSPASSLASVARAAPSPAVPAPASPPDDDFELDFMAPSSPPPASVTPPEPLAVTAPMPVPAAASVSAPAALAPVLPARPLTDPVSALGARVSEPTHEREVVPQRTPPWVWVMLVAGIFFGMVVGMKGSEWFGTREPAVAATSSAPMPAPAPTASPLAQELEIPGAPVAEGDAGVGHDESTDGSGGRSGSSSSRAPAIASAGTMEAASARADDVDFAQFESPTGMSVTPSDVTRTASAAVAPPLDQADVQRVVSNNRRQLQTCYERAARGQANPPRARMDVNVTVGRSGTVTAVTAAGNDFGGLGLCIEQSVRRWRFPASSDGGTTRFPVVFSPGA